MSERALHLFACGHVEVWSEARECPVCAAKRDRDELLQKVGSLKHQLEEALAKPKVKEFLDSRDIAELLGCSLRSVKRYRDEGILPGKALTAREEVLRVVPKINERRKGHGVFLKAA